MIFELRDAFQDIQQTLADFRLMWMPHVVDGDVYEVPLNNNGLAPKIIEVKHIAKEAAAIKAAEAFEVLHFQANQHPATAYRLPGWLGVDRDFSPEIDIINAKKDTLKRLMLSIPEKERNRTTRQALPNVSVLQCYRHLVQWTAPECLYFSWAGATPSSVHVSRADVEAQLERSRKNRPDQFTPSEWENIINLQKQQLAEVPPEIPLIYRWRKAPHPRMMAYNKGQKSNAGRIVPANLPVFIYLNEPTQKPRVYGLNPFDMSEHLRETPRADAALLSSVIESIGLFAQVKSPKKVLINEQALHDGATTRNNEWQRKPITEE
ncbi:DNA replication terminus site-binding protein [Agitococcus lubricus]|uniref:DNA replication terminus site binding protein n=1 Tax=Agitococcus lubricus TaxID=1077255 RepID=A0A2T5IYQ1_9GAMM|nr:DNA replication terminus site-binding protein [Agitococcus lubricus]PTQ89145.1 DNA replication terminus site binding protein [Agitococcus lubricus]